MTVVEKTKKISDSLIDGFEVFAKKTTAGDVRLIATTISSDRSKCVGFYKNDRGTILGVDISNADVYRQKIEKICDATNAAPQSVVASAVASVAKEMDLV